MRKSLFIWALALASLVLLAGCGQKQLAGGEKPDIIIGVVAPITGPLPEFGEYVKQGVNLAVEEINKKGGVDGRKIQVVYKDDEMKPDKATLAVNELVLKSKIKIIIGSASTPPALAMLPLVNENRIIHFPSAVGAKGIIDPEKNPYTFRANYNQVFPAQAAVSYLVDVKKIDKIAIVGDSTPYGKGLAATVSGLIEKRGLKLAAIETYNPGELDLTAHALKVKSSGAQAMYIAGTGAETALLTKAVKKAGFEGIIIGQEGLAQRVFRENVGPEGAGVLAAFPRKFAIAQGAALPAQQKEFIAELQKRGTLEDPPTTAANYDAVYLLAEAIRRAGGADDPEKLKTALESVHDFEGMASTATFGPDDHEAYQPGAFTIVYTTRYHDGFFERVADAQ